MVAGAGGKDGRTAEWQVAIYSTSDSLYMFVC